MLIFGASTHLQATQASGRPSEILQNLDYEKKETITTKLDLKDPHQLSINSISRMSKTERQPDTKLSISIHRTVKFHIYGEYETVGHPKLYKNRRNGVDPTEQWV